MKPKINDKKCGASKDSCKIIALCPTGAISYIEVEEPIIDKNLECNCSSSCGCGNEGDSCGCGGNSYSRIVIDYDKCIECGLCAEECCGAAIDMI